MALILPTSELDELDQMLDNQILHDKIMHIYEDNQQSNVRQEVHLSDLTKGTTYNGKPTDFCYRKLVLSAHHQSVNIKIPHPKTAIFESGWDFHKRWQDKFIKAGVVVTIEGVYGVEAPHEVQFYQTLLDDLDIDALLDAMDVAAGPGDYLPQEASWRLLFTPDVMIDLHDGVGPRVVELKGYNSKTYNAMVKDPAPPPDAFKQVNSYMYLTGIPNGLILVENKESQAFFVREVQLDIAALEPFEERVAIMDALDREYRTSGILPKRICANDNVPFACECPMRRVCFGTEIERRARRLVR